MNYIALYRKFRPITFADMVGQENIVKILKHQIVNNQIGHAYLFCGGRGTGKTSTAKIFSRAINCEHSNNGEPCNECDICKGILNSSLVDVQEIDAASNNSVDNIRAIREDVIFAPTMAKYKIYIIDEVHMLSTGAFNALLKTLEEPPEHVIFILATTEPHKIPVTILSRCQRFEFKRISINDITKRLSYICEQSNVQFDEIALNIIAQSAEGALRDAISILDQVISSGITNITEENVKEILGISSIQIVYNLVNSILSQDMQSSLNTLHDVINSGRDIKYFTWQVITLCRDALIYNVSQDTTLLTHFSALEEIKKLSTTQKDQLTNVISVFSELENKLKWAAYPDITLETTVIKLCNPIQQAVVAQTLQQPIVTQATAPITSTTSSITPTPEKPIQSKPKFNNWNDILNNLKKSGKVMLYGALVNTSANISEDTITINFSKENGFGKTIVEKPDNLASLKEILQSSTGKTYNIKCILEESNTASDDNDLENKLKNSGINVTIS